MPLYAGLLVSCQRNFEHSASSEIHYALTNELDIDRSLIKVRHTQISGLITVKLDEELDYHEIVRKLIDLEDDGAYFMHCLKIRPVDHIVEEGIENLVASIKEREIPDGTYRITVSKRHTPLSSMDIIEPIADIISNPVDLETPDWEVWVEIVADQWGYSLIQPELVFSTQLAYQQIEDDVTNWFLD